MGYLHIDNLYKNTKVLMFREMYALEKIHGTSAHVLWKEGKVHFFSGGVQHNNFVKLFDEAALTRQFIDMGEEEVIIFGEAYGGKCQGMSGTYGIELKFVAFDVKIGKNWLDVPNMDQVARRFGFDVVAWEKVPASVISADIERDKPSIQAIKNGCGNDKIREGVVLRPLFESVTNNGQRVIAKHKRDEFRETASPRKVVDLAKLEVIKNARMIAEEWVTTTRLAHVLDKIPSDQHNMENMRTIIASMVEDVFREGDGEIVKTKDAEKAIGARTVKLFRDQLNNALASQPQVEVKYNDDSKESTS